MNPGFEQLEREIDRQLAALAPRLRDPVPPPERVAEMKIAVRDEVSRLRRQQRRLTVLRPWIGVAAAVLLAVGLGFPRDSQAPELVLDLGANPDLFFADWVDALGESGEQFTWLFYEDWLRDPVGPDIEQDREVNDPLDTLQESLDAFRRMIEA